MSPEVAETVRAFSPWKPKLSVDFIVVSVDPDDFAHAAAYVGFTARPVERIADAAHRHVSAKYTEVRYATAAARRSDRARVLVDTRQCLSWAQFGELVQAVRTEAMTHVGPIHVRVTAPGKTSFGAVAGVLA